MRLDKYLKVSRIIKRRTSANEACTGGRVMLNNRVAKPGTQVSVGDLLTIRFGEHIGQYRILLVSETVRKENADSMYEIIQEDNSMKEERDQA